MRFANVDGTRSEAQPKLRGICRGCGEEVIAKCGKHVVWHWAHRSLANCDRWWEAETEWHRAWKNRFPVEWQETILHDSASGEKHIADVKTAHGVVVEFQRSSIDPAEVKLREQFYQRMVWVIDGTRNELDQANFGMSRSRVDGNGFASLHWFSRSKLFARWHTTVPVFIDFGEGHGFWRICRFDPVTKRGVLKVVDRSVFADELINGLTDYSRNGGPASA
ncbi:MULTISPECIES: competence protein CoiA [Pseudomonas]|uniref:competence protein CoiA n=1 Tax=Pseudomonas TaxID=286 RepID=UPI000736A956|nr:MULTISPECIES: competence protein CoiA family protein [Pseudomonas]KTT25448.1 hypothetical protein SB14R_06840 [Pseudomonas psychrotolerans]KTT53366.1 hypothetical protein NS337_13795 [Pseudomonas psychrotolerans]